MFSVSETSHCNVARHNNFPEYNTWILYPLTYQAEGLLSLPASVYMSVRPHVCPSINLLCRHRFKLESPNLQLRCILVYSKLGLFTGCLWSLIPLGAHKLMHALKLYGPLRGGIFCTALYVARTGPVFGRTIFVQNSPGTARTGPGCVMWLGY